MPPHDTRDTLQRQWELLTMLTDRPPGATAAELTAGLEGKGFKASKRTVQRDLVKLSESFPAIVCNDKGQPFGWHWAKGTAVPIPGISLPEAVSLQILDETLKPLLPKWVLEVIEPRLHLAQAMLASRKDQTSAARLADKVRSIMPTQPLLPPNIQPQVLEVVQEALFQEQQLTASYLRMGSTEPKEYTLHPVALVQRGVASYLAATAYDYEDIRFYALHRIQQAEPTGQPATIPPDFDIDRYEAKGHFQFGNGKTLKLKAQVSQWLARILDETPLSDDQTLRADGDEQYKLAATVQDTWQLRWWLLSQGPGLQVLRPKRLKQEIYETLSEAVQLYEA